MITGFFEQTKDLTDYELQLVPVFVRGFAKKIGKENAITNKEILAKMKGHYKLSDARIRKLINHIRNGDFFGDHILKATSDGYYLTNDPGEIMDYVKSLESRINAIAAIKNKIEKKLKPAA